LEFLGGLIVTIICFGHNLSIDNACVDAAFPRFLEYLAEFMKRKYFSGVTVDGNGHKDENMMIILFSKGIYAPAPIFPHCRIPVATRSGGVR
jgi:hypothetical protein